jgi:hypothetical protein
MPTPQHHLSYIFGGMAHNVSDKVALAAAGVVGSAPLWALNAQDVSGGFVTWGPILAGLLVVSKIVLVWVQIWKAARGGPPPP